jgi:hypothetical protein
MTTTTDEPEIPGLISTQLISTQYASEAHAPLRGFDPLEDAIDDGRHLLAPLREAVAARGASRASAAAE